jgi:hypothetical protein
MEGLPTIQTEPAVSAAGIVFSQPRHAGCKIPALRPLDSVELKRTDQACLSPRVSDPGLLRLPPSPGMQNLDP